MPHYACGGFVATLRFLAKSEGVGDLSLSNGKIVLLSCSPSPSLESLGTLLAVDAIVLELAVAI